MKGNDPLWIAAATAARNWQIEISEQPPNSPDTNILKLVFFRSLEANVWKMKRGKTIDDLIANVQQAFQDYDPVVLNRIWLSHQAVCDEILKDHGGNDFNLPHLQKEKLEKEGQLPRQLPVSDDALEAFDLVSEEV